MAFDAGAPEERHLKMATLLFDRVYLPVGAQRLNRVCALVAGDLHISVKAVTQAWQSMEIVDPALGQEDLIMRTLAPPNSAIFDKSGNWRKGLRGAIDETIARQMNLSLHGVRKLKHENPYGYIREGNALANTAVGSVLVWTVLRTYVQCAYFAFNPVEFAAAYLLLKSDEGTPFRSANFLLPNAEKLPWQEVFEIRGRPEAISFRRWFRSRMAGNANSQSIEADIIGALLEIIEDLRPNIGSEILKGIASNIPLPIPINPASVTLSAKSLANAVRFKKKYSWAAFLQMANR